MKKLQLIITLTLLLNLGMKSQTYVPFPTANASWNVRSIRYCDDLIHPDTSIIRYKLQGDTIINSLQYHKLYLELGDTLTPQITFVGALRELNKKIYITSFAFAAYLNQEWLLYDFSVQVGDTIKHDPNYGYPYTVISDIDSVLIDGAFRKRYKVDRGFTDYITEGIGSVTKGLLDHITPIPTGICGTSSDHICFEENGVVKYLNPAFSDCSSTQRIAGINEIPSEKQPNIEISAVDGVLSLHSTTQDIRSIKLVTPNGSVLFEDNSVKENFYKKQLNYRGVLFCIIGFENGEVSTEKILVK